MLCNDFNFSGTKRHQAAPSGTKRHQAAPSGTKLYRLLIFLFCSLSSFSQAEIKELPVEADAVKIEVVNNTMPDAWKSNFWIIRGNNIYVFYAGELYDELGDPKKFKLDLKFTGSNVEPITRIKKIVPKDRPPIIFDPPVNDYTLAQFEIIPDQKPTIDIYLSDAQEVRPPLTLHFLSISFVPDVNRDGAINKKDKGKIKEAQPFRWWVNDDDDVGEAAGGSNSTGDVPNKGTEDYKDNSVDGMRDLVDFFPIQLDIVNLVKVLPAPEFTYRLKHSQKAFKFVEVTEIVPEGDPKTNGAGSFIRSLDQATSLSHKDLKDASSAGQDLSEEILSSFKKGEGILLLEAARETIEPLQLEIREGLEAIGIVNFPVNISKVEKMYRHVDLRSIAKEYDGTAINAAASVNGTKTGDPSSPYPDELTNGKYFVFVHGYNVTQNKARGWHSETFKRLHQMGSKARYVGVVWQGDTGIDYHKAVFQALQTGDHLKSALDFVEADFTIAAQSLGNMVVSQAIQNGGLAPDRFYLIDAAVAREAFGGAIPPAERTMMIEDGVQIGNNGPHIKRWRNYDAAGQSRLLSPQWHAQFLADDNRSKLKWKDSFNNVTNLPIYNFYSPGDEVVRDPEDASASALALILNQGFEFSTYAWANQEYVKGGTSLAAKFMIRNQGGWVYNYFPPDAPDDDDDPIPAETFATGYFKDARDEFPSFVEYRKYHEIEAQNELTNAELSAKPFFRPFLELGLFNPTTGSALAAQTNVKYDLLARGLPALSYAAATNTVNGATRNFNMEAEFMTDPEHWPLENHQSNENPENPEEDLWSGRWLHNDIKNIALSHNYKAYEKMIEIGGLDE